MIDNLSEELALMIRSGHHFVSVDTSDENRAVQIVLAAAAQLMVPVYDWAMTTGLREIELDGSPGRTIIESPKAEKSLEFVGNRTAEAVYIFRDLGPQGKDAAIVRMLRDLESDFSTWNASMVFIDSVPLPGPVRKLTVRFEIGWPTAGEIEAVVRDTFKKIRKDSLRTVESKVTKRDVETIVQTLRGLSLNDVARVISTAVYDNYALTPDDLPRIVEAKRTLLGNTGTLEAIAVDFSADDIGGLKNLKAWLKQRRGGFTRKAQDYGIEAPRGVLMLGVPGCGKSLCAKVCAADWGMPLLRLDPGVLYQKYIGESENQLRQSLQQAEAMAPVVLWIDEIEKAFASASSGSADGGLSQRMFGTLLSWMQDHRHPIFICATANDISKLPPELMRKGRFDEVFFVDLPSAEAREQILEIHLRRRDRDPENFTLSDLAAASENFSGSELEQAIASALFASYSEDSQLVDSQIVSEMQKTRPLAVLTAEKIADLRAWAEDRCVPAD